MRLFYSDLISDSQDAISDTSSTVKTFLKKRINRRYELMTDKLITWTQSQTRTAPTGTAAGADQQYYANPPNLREIESLVVTIGTRDYPLWPVDSQQEWDALNAEVVSSTFPERYFRRAADYGIWPIPNEDDGTITINYTQRAVPLYFENYTTGTVAVVENDQTVTITTGVTTTLKPGFWFTLTDSSGLPRGTSYKILSITDSTHFELESYFEETAETGITFIVGQSPEIPEEGHDLLTMGAVADFYGLKTKDMEAYTRFNNMFWTGSPNISPNQVRKSDENSGGLLGLIASYADRDSSPVVSRTSYSRDVMEFRIPRTISV